MVFNPKASNLRKIASFHSTAHLEVHTSISFMIIIQAGKCYSGYRLLREQLYLLKGELCLGGSFIE